MAYRGTLTVIATSARFGGSCNTSTDDGLKIGKEIIGLFIGGAGLVITLLCKVGHPTHGRKGQNASAHL